MLKLNGVDFILNYNFNYGRILGFIFIIQVISGLILRLYYSSESNLSFNSIQYLIIEVNKGWLIRLIHFNLVSFFFMMLFLHILKALFFFSYRLKIVWFVGLVIFLILILEAFLGYALIWSQISFWAATVITSLIRVVPVLGWKFIIFFWGGYYLNSFSLKLFFFIHFILPLLIFFFVIIHLLYLHKYGSSIVLNNSSKLIKRRFFPFFWVKDMINIVFIFLFFLFFLMYPFKFNESLSFVFVNNLISPIHIVPEWYFLWSYAILRAVSIKWLGVIMILFSIIVYFFITRNIINFDLLNKILICFFVYNFLILVWLGRQEPIFPYVDLSFFFSLIYFFILILFNLNLLL